MEVNQERIEKAVVAEVAEMIISQEELRNRVIQAVDNRIANHFKEIADKQIANAVNNAIREGFEHEYVKIDHYGRREGEATTISKELNKLIAGYWNQKVDSSGNSSDGYSAKATRAEWVMSKLIAADFEKEMKQHVVNLGAQLKDNLRKELHETVNKLMTEVFHVRSWDDQAAGSPGATCIMPPETPKK